MVPFLTAPLALLGLLCVPLLVAIYLFHRRPRVVVVSSLLLWSAVRQPRGGGRTTEPPRFPLTFWLELVMIVLLVLAAAAPMVPWLAERRPLVVILDDSLSMQAGRGSDTGRQRALEFLERDITSQNFTPIHFVLAGATPQILGSSSSHAESRSLLAKWRCTSPAADIDAALATAAQIAEHNALYLVVTDRAPQRKMGPRIRWQAFGRAEANIAFVSARRSEHGTNDNVLLEIANYSSRAQSTNLAVTSGTHSMQQRRIDLAANERQRISFDVPTETGDVEARISDDAAAFDNRVVLLPERRPLTRVQIEIADERLRADVQRAVEATNRVNVGNGADILITDRAVSAPSWALQFIDHKQPAVSHAGPFLIDRTHPLSEGVNLDGIIWTASNTRLNGAAVVLTGSQQLVSDEALANGAHIIHVALEPELSNLQKAPAWPAIFWNLIAWRSSLQPGMRESNVTLGSNAELIVPPGTREARITTPDGIAHTTIPAPSSLIVPIAATEPGVWSITAGDVKTRFATNALVPNESDLTNAASGTKASWSSDAAASGGYYNLAPLLLLAALAVAALHQRVTAETAPA